MDDDEVKLGYDEPAGWVAEAAPEETARIVDALYRVQRLVAAVTDLDMLLERIMQESKQVAQAEAASLMLYDREADELFFHVALSENGDMDALKQEIRLKPGQGIAGAAAQSRATVRVDDAKNDSRFFADADEASRFETRSLLAAPLVDRGELVGVIEVVNKAGGGRFTAVDERVLEIFSRWVATTIANARLIEENIAAERLAALGQAVAGLSHFTKNILSGMSGSVELIEDLLRSKKYGLVEETWPVVKRSTNRISLLVEDMLAFSKKRKPFVEPTPVRDLVDEVCESFWALMAKRNVALTVETDRVGDSSFPMDGRGIFRCVLNLLTNAADAVPKQGGRIAVRARYDDEALIVEVEDNGPGVDDAVIAKIFDPFFSTKGSKGTGLGLSVTRKVVEEHGGTMSVDRGEWGGARFTIVLPKPPLGGAL